jgi:hypothetical protein
MTRGIRLALEALIEALIEDPSRKSASKHLGVEISRSAFSGSTDNHRVGPRESFP